VAISSPYSLTFTDEGHRFRLANLKEVRSVAGAWG
jgi:hypothetical protein